MTEAPPAPPSSRWRDCALVYLIPVFVIGVLLFLYDTHDMRRLDSVGLRYLLAARYWPCFIIRFAWQLGAASLMFRTGTFLLSGNGALSIPNVVGAVSAASAVAVTNIWREERAREDPKVASLFGFFQLWKIRVTTEIIDRRDELIRETLLRNSDWLLKRLNTSSLRKTYLKVHRDKYGPHAARQAKDNLRRWRVEYKDDDAAYRRRIADETGSIRGTRLWDRLFHAIGRGKFK